MQSPQPKAVSVSVEGQEDGFEPARGYRVQVAPDGTTRLVASVPPAELRNVHLRLIAALGGPLSVRYLRLTDRVRGQLPKPESWVRMDVPAGEVVAALDAASRLVWEDGRHQLWIRGPFGEQVVLDEMGVLYCYPDDPAFREALLDLPEHTAVGMDGRDYVKVHFHADADSQETQLREALRLTKIG
ncbi:MAG: hypothetical protein RLZZ299_3120 [Pseudomonadota bacterium]|jgi:hypothetical protein